MLLIFKIVPFELIRKGANALVVASTAKTFNSNSLRTLSRSASNSGMEYAEFVIKPII